MHIVAAGVHHAFVLGAVGNVVGFRDGQGVGIRAQGDGGPGASSALNLPNQARTRHFAAGDAEFLQLPGDVALGFVLLEAEFGVRVQVPAVGDGTGRGGTGSGGYSFFQVCVGHDWANFWEGGLRACLNLP